jgi:hypothetical protein
LMNDRNPGRIVYVLVLVGAALAMSCSAVQSLTDRDGARRGYLELIVEPETVEVFINSEYQGLVSGWRGGVIPVVPGMQRVELRAEGYMTQRFDLGVAPNELVTLELTMERELDESLPEDRTVDHGLPLP